MTGDKTMFIDINNLRENIAERSVEPLAPSRIAPFTDRAAFDAADSQREGAERKTRFVSILETDFDLLAL